MEHCIRIFWNFIPFIHPTFFSRIICFPIYEF